MEQFINSFKKFTLLIAILSFGWISLLAQSAGPPQDVACDQAVLAATGGPGMWSTAVVGVTFDDPAVANTTARNLQVGPNLLIWTVGGTDYQVVITRYTAAAGTDRFMCSSMGSNATMGATLPGSMTGLWTGGGANIVTPTSPTSAVNSVASGATATLTWEIQSSPGCTSTDVATVTNNTQTITAGSDQTLCAENGITVLAGTDPVPLGGTGQWSSGVAGIAFVDDTNPGTGVTVPFGTNTITWSITVSGCISTANTDIINDLFPVRARADVNNLCNDEYRLSVQANGVGGVPGNRNGEWSIVSGTGVLDNPLIHNTWVRNLSPGLNELDWTVTTNGCPAVERFNITNIQPVGVDAGTDQVVCETVLGGNTADVTMNASNPGAGTGLWVRISGPNPAPTITTPNSEVSTITGIVPGTHEFVWRVTETGCSVEDTVLIINEQPTVSAAGPDRESCNGTYVLEANNPTVGIGQWTGPGGVTFANTSINNTTVSNLVAGSNVLTWTITNNACVSTDDIVITNNTVTVANAGIDQILCTNTTALNGNNPSTGTGVWSVESGALPTIIVDPTLRNTTLINIPRATAGPVVLRWTITLGTCSSFDEVNISNVSVNADAGVDKAVCTNPVDYFLQGNDPTGQSVPGYPATGQWTNASMPPLVITNTAQYNSTISNLFPDDNTFIWTVSNGTCSDVDAVVITNNVPQETPEAGPNQTLCATSTTLAGNEPTGGTGISPYWSLIDGAGTFADNTAYNTAVTNLEYYVENAGPNYWQTVRTINRFRWTFNKNGCEIWDDVGVINALPQAANAGVDQQVCWNEANLNATDLGSGSMESYWVQGDGCSALPSNSATITGPTEFNAHVSNIRR